LPSEQGEIKVGLPSSDRPVAAETRLFLQGKKRRRLAAEKVKAESSAGSCFRTNDSLVGFGAGVLPSEQGEIKVGLPSSDRPVAAETRLFLQGKRGITVNGGDSRLRRSKRSQVPVLASVRMTRWSVSERAEAKLGEEGIAAKL
jgi:hypothetical protein